MMERREANEVRGKGEKLALNSRKKTRQQLFEARRNAFAPPPLMQEQSRNYARVYSLLQQPQYSHIKQLYEQTGEKGTFEQYQQLLSSSDLGERIGGLIRFREFLEQRQSQMEVIADVKNLIRTTVELFAKDESLLVRAESAACLAIFSGGSGLECETIADLKVIPLLMQGLNSQYVEIVGLCVSIIGNIGADSSYLRDKILRVKGVPLLVQTAEKWAHTPNYSSCLWAIATLCRGQPEPRQEYVEQALPFLVKSTTSMKVKGNKEAIGSSLWGINALLTRNCNQPTLFDAKFVSKLIRLTEVPEMEILIPTLKIMGKLTLIKQTNGTRNIVSQLGIPALQLLLDHSNAIVRGEVCWILSHISASPEQAYQVFSNSVLMDKIISMFEGELPEVQKQICCIFGSFAATIDPQQNSEFVLRRGILGLFVMALKSTDLGLIKEGLSNLWNLLRVGQKFMNNGCNPIAEGFISVGGRESLAGLQAHKNKEVIRRVEKIRCAFVSDEQ